MNPESTKHNLENTITSNYMILKRYSGSVSWDEMKARTQAEREMNAALDIYPAGLPRNEITLEEAQRIASLGRYALEEAA